MMTRALIALFLLVALAGCASAKKSYSKANDAETEGRWAEAAEQYLDALRRDPEFPEARERAQHAGGRAIEGWLITASSLDEAGRYEMALRQFEKVDRLANDAASVGVVLHLPPDYVAFKMASTDRAILAAFDSADEYARSGQFDASFTGYRQLETRYALSDEHARRLRRSKLDVLLADAESALTEGRYGHARTRSDIAMDIFGPDAEESRPVHDLIVRVDAARYHDLIDDANLALDEGRFREAYQMTTRALEVYGTAATASIEAEELLERVLDEGTVHVVAMPVWRADGVAELVVGDEEPTPALR